MKNAATNASIQAQIAKGWKPNYYLTNMSVAHFQPDDWFVSPFIFPLLPVSLSTGHYYVFNKADLARDNVQRKPKYGKVTPMIFGTSEESYSCDVDQVIVGLDQISTLDYQRANTPGISDPRRAKVRMATEQLKTARRPCVCGRLLQGGRVDERIHRRFHHPHRQAVFTSSTTRTSTNRYTYRLAHRNDAQRSPQAERAGAGR